MGLSDFRKYNPLSMNGFLCFLYCVWTLFVDVNILLCYGKILRLLLNNANLLFGALIYSATVFA
jgi:hypothetical protein